LVLQPKELYFFIALH